MKNNKKWNLWKNDFHGIKWLKTAFIFVLFFFSYPLLENYYSSSILSEFLSGFRIDFPSGVSLVIIPIIIFVKKILRLYEGLLPKPQRLAGVMVFWAIYFWQWRFSGLYEFNLISCSPLAWFDLLPISLGLLFLKMKTYEGWIQVINATPAELFNFSAKTSLGVLNPNLFLGRLFKI
jgi:hypothetical protein